MGFIYLITCKINLKCYIGQTISTINNRWYQHKQCAKLIIRANNKDPTLNIDGFYQKIKGSPLYRAMAKHGIDSFIIREIEEMDDDLLNEAETQFIEEFDCIVPKGYNATSGGDSHYSHARESIQKMIDKKRENLENNRHEYLFGMPQYITYGKNPRRGGEWIIFQNHPLCKYKAFFVKKYGSMEKVQEAVLNFITKLEISGKPHEKQKKENDLKSYPGLKATKKGYKIEKFYCERVYRAGFESLKNTREENKKRATEYYKKLMHQLNIPMN